MKRIKMKDIEGIEIDHAKRLIDEIDKRAHESLGDLINRNLNNRFRELGIPFPKNNQERAMLSKKLYKVIDEGVHRYYYNSNNKPVFIMGMLLSGDKHQIDFFFDERQTESDERFYIPKINDDEQD